MTSRPDLNVYHLLARAGLKAVSGDKEMLRQYNAKGWLPVHLSKNKSTAQWLYEETLLQGVQEQEIIEGAILNNAESTQTQYGKDLENVLLQYGFCASEASQGSHPPDTKTRIDLSLFWIEKLDKLDNIKIFKKSIEIALKNSNSFFFFALKKNNEVKKLIDTSISIGESFYISDRAFQLQQIIKNNYCIVLPISHNINQHVKKTNNYLANLEGS